MKRLTRLVFVGVWLAIASATVVTVAPPAAHAQNTEAKLEGMLDQACEDYDVLMIGDAKKKLQDAVALANQEGVSGPVVAELYVMLAIVEFAEARNEDAARQSFVTALEQDYSVSIPAHYRNPTLSKAMEAARQEVPEPKDGQDGGQNAQASRGSFEHDPVQTAKAGEPMSLQAFIPTDMPVYRVNVFHRRFGETGFEKLEMKATGATRFAVDIPAEQVRTSQIEYYIEAVDRNGDVMAQAGTKDGPMATTVLGSSDQDSSNGEVGDGEVGEGEGGDGEGGDKIEDPDESSGHNVYVMLLGGTGVSFLPDGSPTAHPERSVLPGVALAFGHGMIDTGYMITDHAHLGLYFRWQFSPPQDFSRIPDVSKEAGNFANTKEECMGLGLPGDCMLGLKYRWFFKDMERFRLYSSTGVGIGRVRSWLRLKQQYYASDDQTPTAACAGKERVSGDEGSDFCYVRDTVRPGWAHFGVGAGAMWPLHENVEIVADGYLVVLVPETGINFDLNLGMNFRF